MNDEQMSSGDYYFETADVTISRKRAVYEICNIHQVPRSELKYFYQEYGFKDSYNGQEVLTWLGY